MQGALASCGDELARTRRRSATVSVGSVVGGVAAASLSVHGCRFRGSRTAGLAEGTALGPHWGCGRFVVRTGLPSRGSRERNRRARGTALGPYWGCAGGAGGNSITGSGGGAGGAPGGGVQLMSPGTVRIVRTGLPFPAVHASGTAGLAEVRTGVAAASLLRAGYALSSRRPRDRTGLPYRSSRNRRARGGHSVEAVVRTGVAVPRSSVPAASLSAPCRAIRDPPEHPPRTCSAMVRRDAA